MKISWVDIVIPSNEQHLDRLTVEVMKDQNL